MSALIILIPLYISIGWIVAKLIAYTSDEEELTTKIALLGLVWPLVLLIYLFSCLLVGAHCILAYLLLCIGIKYINTEKFSTINSKLMF